MCPAHDYCIKIVGDYVWEYGELVEEIYEATYNVNCANPPGYDWLGAALWLGTLPIPWTKGKKVVGALGAAARGARAAAKTTPSVAYASPNTVGQVVEAILLPPSGNVDPYACLWEPIGDPIKVSRVPPKAGAKPMIWFNVRWEELFRTVTWCNYLSKIRKCRPPRVGRWEPPMPRKPSGGGGAPKEFFEKLYADEGS